jgi:hypothetical protein
MVCSVYHHQSSIALILYVTIFFIFIVFNITTSIITFITYLGCIQQKFTALCFNCFFPHVHCSYSYASEQLKLHSLHEQRYNLDALYFIHIYLWSKFCPLLETVGLQVSACSIRDFPLFNVKFSSKNCPSVR